MLAAIEVERRLAQFGIHPDPEDLAAIAAMASGQQRAIERLRTIAAGAGALALALCVDEEPG
jgi:hypothetical protein